MNTPFLVGLVLGPCISSEERCDSDAPEFPIRLLGVLASKCSRLVLHYFYLYVEESLPVSRRSI